MHRCSARGYALARKLEDPDRSVRPRSGPSRRQEIEDRVPIPIVAVEIAPADSDPRLVQTLVTACSTSVAIGHCLLANREPEALEPSAVAIVAWQTNEQVRIEVGIRRDQSARWLTQKLSFRRNDAPSERWRAVGLAIGTLVGEMTGAVKPPEMKRPMDDGELASAQQDAPHRTVSGQRTSSSRAEIRLDAGAMAGPGLDRGAWRRGGFLRSSYRLRDSAFSFGLSTSYALRPKDEAGVRVEWATVGVGGGHAFEAAASVVGVELRLELLLQYVRVSATEEDSSRTGSADAWLTGARVGLVGSWLFSPPFGLVLEGDIALLNASVDVRLRDEPLGTAASLYYGFVAGMRVRLD
jgi:hypothetical protein